VGEGGRRLTVFKLLTVYLISSHLISSHLISSHLISSHLISSRLISFHFTISFYFILFYFILLKLWIGRASTCLQEGGKGGGKLCSEGGDWRVACRIESKAGEWVAGRIAKEVSKVSMMHILDPKGNYVLEKIVDFGQVTDIVTILRPLCKDPFGFVKYKFGFLKFVKGVDKLVCPPSPCQPSLPTSLPQD
jgi:hypothetical protein